MARNRVKKNKDSYPQLIKEITVFLIFLGVLIGAAGYYAYTGLQGNPHDLWGYRRYLAIGVPTLVIDLLHFVAGIGLAATGGKSYAIFGGVASTALAVFYYVFMISATGEAPINLVSLVVISIPVLVWARVSLFLKVDQGGQVFGG